ncbi:LysR family transcriptional regulator [Aminobacter sp. Y103A]|jgi:DNA-binding transcriptional LysR family regulator|uniref:LysR family transcriptional regulator n=1 Tax=Aminobacter sp. Y103A TaxID=1870862 RepID=UPI00257328E5|nr:LysR family transcriptional regulator [Aminobacter sp. SS-2016]BBD38663.1 LysR family transcriptional regulator [Aminobacter sp. SS-2016]
MTRVDVNRFGEMEVFVRAVESGGFSAGARALDMSPSAVSKLVSRLENRLGTRLVNRSTRRLQLTPEGCAFYERSVVILADLKEAEQCAAAGEAPRGRLRVNANVPFGKHFLLPLLPQFLARYPEISVDIALSDIVVDLLEARADVAIRAGPMKSSSLVARKLGATRMMIVGAPAYIAMRGMPRSADELKRHNLLGPSYARTMPAWPVLQGGAVVDVTPTGNVQASDGEALRELALAGIGLARIAAFQVRDDLAAGRLANVLEEANPGDLEDVHAVFLGNGGPVPARVRALLDFLAETVDLGGS